jgi:hypothetical protein
LPLRARPARGRQPTLWAGVGNALIEPSRGSRNTGALTPGAQPVTAFVDRPEIVRGAWFLAICLPFDAFGSEFWA